MGGEKPANPRSSPRCRWLQRGESAATGIGVAVFLILLAAVAGSGWWVFRTNRDTLVRSNARRVDAVGAVLSQSAEVMLEAGEISSLRRVIVEVGREQDFIRCRIVLPDGHVIAAADAGEITLSQLPPQWSGASRDAPSPPHDERSVSRTYPLTIPGRGAARLEIVASVRPGAGNVWEAEGGLGVIGAASLVLMLIVYRKIRSRVRTMGAIRETLLATADGETSPEVLAVSHDFGPEGRAWNTLVSKLENLEKQQTFERAKEALASGRNVHSSLDSACNAMSQGLVLVDENLRVTYANGAAVTLLKARGGHVVGGEISQFIEQEGVLTATRAAVNGMGPRRSILETQDEGGGGILRFTVGPIRSKDAEFGMIVIEDVTQQRASEEARNAFLAHATHELRTPLTNIRLYLESALEEGERSPTVRAKSLNVINQESRRLERIVGDMLSVAEIEAGSYKIKKDDVRLEQLLKELEEDYRAQAQEKNIDLVFDLSPKLPVIQGDRDKVALGLHNLLGNALKYTPSGGRVVVTAEVPEGEVVIEVADTGIGMSEEDSQRIFEKFYRASDSRVAEVTGSGLGLTLAREVIRLHGGDITVQSEPDKGSTFTVTLPVHSEVTV